MSSASVNNLNKTIFHAITESKYWELVHEILPFFQIIYWGTKQCLTGQQLTIFFRVYWLVSNYKYSEYF